MTCQINFEPLGRRVTCHEGAKVFEVAREAGVGLGSFCGGKGICGKCKIRVLSGQVSPPTENEIEHLTSEDIAQGYRLACLTKALGSIKVEVPREYMVVSQRLQLAGKELEVIAEPIVKAYDVTLSPPSLKDIRADQSRLIDYLADNYGLKDIDIDISVQRRLSGLLRANEWQAKIGLRYNTIVTAGGINDRLLGLAVDLGTTKIAAYLSDLQTGEVLATAGTINRQISYGEDVISRVTHAMENGGETLKQLATDDLNKLIQSLCTETGCESNDIVEVVLVGNTAMHHIFLGLPVNQLALAPFLPAVSSPVDIKAREIGLAVCPGACLHVLPNIAGFVGADHVAMLLATEIYDTKKTIIGIDIGTNTEISLSVNSVIRSCSCASGPAFEGGHIKHGIRATGGAIEGVKITNSSVEIQTIDDLPPIGLCGSGILDTVAQLLEAGIINEMGRLQSHPLVRSTENGPEFLLVPKEESGTGEDITVTQGDIGEIQLAKGAIASGIVILLAEANIGWEDIEEVIIAGAFGTYIDVASAIKIAMLPPLPQERFSQVGNAAGVGARLSLISKNQRELASIIARKANYIELSNYPLYPRAFAKALRFSSDKAFGAARLPDESST